ncbi:Uncharacterised protein family, glycosyl hydrolase catalytic domain [Ceraceosorus bombacis]|uniref:Uncharacterized protein family, glycosyl hydrolase catalytic domain n=1 Tax=Ceraceosorus bombacis TaxID=401625 RepID=A0A0P1BN96_9BASI|nr:Uncharacterised protein family, glycosyl hydrolase catalytic domain [Ceraceosorus bombacis]
MRFTLAISALAALLPAVLVLLSQPTEARNRRCVPHGFDSRWSRTIAKGKLECYHHWQDGIVHEYPGDIEYVPTMWDEKKYGAKWAARKKEMRKKLPRRLLTFNEPDVKGQANMDPYYAADLWMREIVPWQKKGVKVSTPQIVYDLDWMDTFMKQLKKKGTKGPDFMAIHSYTPKGQRGLNQLKSYVKKCRKRYGLKIWVTEYGVTASSKPSAAEIKSYLVQAQNFLDSQSYVKRSFWLGGFAINKPPDGFVTNKNAFFSSSGGLRDIAHWWLYAGNGGKSRRDAAGLPSSPLEHRSEHSPAMRRNHAKLAARMQARAENVTAEADIDAYHADVDAEDQDLADAYDGDEVECDEHCQRLEAMLAKTTDDDDVMKDAEDKIDGEDEDEDTD